MKATHACSSLCYSLLCVFISQYNNKVDSVSMDEAQMGTEGQPVLNWAFPWSRHCACLLIMIMAMTVLMIMTMTFYDAIKSTKIVLVVGQGSNPGPAGGAYDVTFNPLGGLRGGMPPFFTQSQCIGSCHFTPNPSDATGLYDLFAPVTLTLIPWPW